eukprot:307880_1
MSMLFSLLIGSWRTLWKTSISILDQNNITLSNICQHRKSTQSSAPKQEMIRQKLLERRRCACYKYENNVLKQKKRKPKILSKEDEAEAHREIKKHKPHEENKEEEETTEEDEDIDVQSAASIRIDLNTVVAIISDKTMANSDKIDRLKYFKDELAGLVEWICETLRCETAVMCGVNVRVIHQDSMLQKDSICPNCGVTTNVNVCASCARTECTSCGFRR